jgi:hypothetical protein
MAYSQVFENMNFFYNAKVKKKFNKRLFYLLLNIPAVFYKFMLENAKLTILYIHSYRNINSTKAIFPATLLNYKSFFLNFRNDRLTGINIHNIKTNMVITVPEVVPKKFWKTAPV